MFRTRKGADKKAQEVDLDDFILEVEEALELVEELQGELDGLPEEAEKFVCSVETKLVDMQTWAEEHERATRKMMDAVQNIKSGLESWQKRT